MTYEELEKKYHEQGSALGSQRIANVKLKEYNARLKKRVESLEVLINICCQFIEKYPQRVNIGDAQVGEDVMIEPVTFASIARALAKKVS